MVQPRLIHPIPVVIERIDRAATAYDPDTREPLQQAARATPITCPGQVFFSTSTASLRAQRSGVVSGEKGAITFLVRDLNQRGIVFDEAGGDRIIRIGKIEMNVYTTRIDWMGSYTDAGGHTMAKIYFTDRAPSKRTM